MDKPTTTSIITLWDLVGPDKFVVHSNISSAMKSLGRELESLTGRAFIDTNFLYLPARRLVERFQEKKKPPHKFVTTKSNINWMTSFHIQVIYLNRIYYIVE